MKLNALIINLIFLALVIPPFFFLAEIAHLINSDYESTLIYTVCYSIVVSIIMRIIAKKRRIQ